MFDWLRDWLSSLPLGINPGWFKTNFTLPTLQLKDREEYKVYETGVYGGYKEPFIRLPKGAIPLGIYTRKYKKGWRPMVVYLLSGSPKAEEAEGKET